MQEELERIFLELRTAQQRRDLEEALERERQLRQKEAAGTNKRTQIARKPPASVQRDAANRKFRCWP